MVSRTYYPPPPPHPHDGARYLPSRSCAPYYSYPDRRYQLASHDARSMTMTDSQTDETTPPRKRIAVACGRCRKRKIRCSGDPGGGLPCVNCKNAGVDACLFLRVQSQEAPMREDSRYDYNIDVSRSLAQRSGGSMAHISSSMAQYPQEMHLLGSGAMPPSYRGSGYTSVSTKGYFNPVGADWGEAYGPDSAVGDYSLSVPHYQVISSDGSNLVPSYGHWGTRQKNIGQGGSLYVDSESAYPYGTGPGAGLVHRPASSMPSETSAYSFSSIAASLPSAGNERHLPNPAAVSRGMGSSSATYRMDGLPAGYGGTKSGQTSVSGGQASPPPPIADVTAAAAAVGYTSSYDYASVGRSSQHGGSSSDAYGSVSSGSGETIFGDHDRSAASQGSAVDLTGYTYGSAGPTDGSSLRRASSGGLTTRSAAEGSISTGYAASDGASNLGSGSFHNASSSHGQHHRHHHHHHHHHGQSHHPSPRHPSHHHTHPHQLSGAHAVTGSTAYGGVSGGVTSSSSGVSGGVGGTAATDSHRTSISSRR